MSLAFARADHTPTLAAHAPTLTAQLVPPALWDRTVAQFDDLCQEQLFVFAQTRWPKVTLEPVLFWSGGTVVGGCLVMLQKLPLSAGSLAVVKWGPMLARSGEPPAFDRYREMIQLLVADYAQARGFMLSILPRASISPFNAEYDHLVHRGFSPGSRFGFPDRYLVNLRLSDDEQRASFEQKWRYHLKKSEKAGLGFEHASAARFPEFKALYEKMLDRKRFSDHSAYGTFDALMATDNEALRPELFFVRHLNETIAGAVIFKAGKRAVYLYGATNDRALPLRAGYFMHWNIIRWLRDNTAAAWYDLGGTDGFQGLHQFKKGMVGDAGAIRPIPPAANYATRRWPRLVGTLAFRGRDLINDTLRALDTMRPGHARPDQRRRTADPDE